MSRNQHRVLKRKIKSDNNGVRLVKKNNNNEEVIDPECCDEQQ